ncbi:MAG: tetratricopeptide repeat protein [Pseudomonadota bacterium]
MGRGLSVALLACALIGLADDADARRKRYEPRVRDLHYGEVLFHFYQYDHFAAITRLLAAREQERIAHHSTEAELLLGGMFVSYGQQEDAEQIFQSLLAQDEREEVRDRAWFYLAKIAYQRAQPDRAARALGEIGGSLPRDLDAQRKLLASRLYMDTGQYDQAAAQLERWKGSDEYLDYARYNLGVALVRGGDVQRGTRFLQRIGAGREQPDRVGFFGSLGYLFTPWRLLKREGAIDVDLTYEEHQALTDKANVALGFAFLQDDQPDQAARYLGRVEDASPWSARARLGLGWAYAAQGEYQRALDPWQALEAGDPFDPAVQEAFLAVPYALGKLEDYPGAVDRYTAAIGTFNDEMARIDRVAYDAASGGFLGELLASVEGDDLGWFWQLERLPDTPQTRYLYRLLAEHSFQEALKNYRDLRLLRQNLEGWREGVSAYQDMLASRRTRFDDRVELMSEALASGRLGALDERGERVRARLERVRVEADAAGLVSADEQAVQERLGRVRDRLDTLPADAGRYTEQLDELRNKYRVLDGVLSWQLEEEYAARLWDRTKSVRELDGALAEAHTRTEALLAAREGADERLQRFAERVEAIVPRVDALTARIDGLMDEHGDYIYALATRTLDQRRARLAAYLTEAQYALASVYDSAAHGDAP